MGSDLGNLESETLDIKEIEEWEKNLAWMLKGVACQTSSRLVQKFGNPQYTPNKEFALQFCKSYA